MRSKFIVLLLPLLLGAFELPDLTYNGATPEKLKHERYNKLELWSKQGYVSHYGETWAQSYRFAAPLDAHEQKLRSFFATAFGIDAAAFTKNYAQFEKPDGTYYLKLDAYANSYSYVLLHVSPTPKVITLPAKAPYRMEKRVFDIPENPLIPDAAGFAIRRAKYVDYDEVTWYYKHNGKSKHIHKGRHWKIDFAKTVKDTNSYRYMLAHDYKTDLTSMGAEMLQDKDESFYFKMGNNVASFNSYENTFSLEIIEEEAFVQSLILSPDAIKTELDKSGKITLEGIFFDFDKATLKPESHKAILSAAALMQRYGDLELSIHGYTDSKGDDTYNATLSVARAKAVMDAIIAEGIEARRLSYKGHGEAEPVTTNDTDEGRAQNRRVELHKERGGNKSSVITIDFIKPIEGSIISEKRSYEDDEQGIDYTQPYSQKRAYQTYKGHLDVIGYTIMKEGKKNEAFSRKAIIKNYENVLELYNAKIVGHYGDTLSFEIPDRGDGKHVYGRINGYDGTYEIRFLIEEK